MAELTPEQRAALWKAGTLDVEDYNQKQEELKNLREDEPIEAEISAEQKERQERIDKKMRDAEEYVQRLKREGAIKWSDKPGAYSTSGSGLFDGVHTGPRGGRYRINSNGRKSYDVP